MTYAIYDGNHTYYTNSIDEAQRAKRMGYTVWQTDCPMGW